MYCDVLSHFQINFRLKKMVVFLEINLRYCETQMEGGR